MLFRTLLRIKVQITMIRDRTVDRSFNALIKSKCYIPMIECRRRKEEQEKVASLSIDWDVMMTGSLTQKLNGPFVVNLPALDLPFSGITA